MDFLRGGAVFFLFVVQLLHGTKAQTTCFNEVSLTPDQPSTTVYMPNYYDASYPSTPYTCTWRVPAPPGYKVRLTLRDVNTTSSETLTVYSRTAASGTYTMALTGPLNYPIAPLVSPHGIFLKYSSEIRRREGRGFLADLSLTEEMQSAGAMSCGGKIFLSESEPAVDIRAPYSSASVSVPLSPKPIGQATCRWVVEAPPNKRIKIIWNNVDTKNAVIRVFNRKTMRSTGRTTKLKGQINQGLAPFISSNNDILFILEREGTLDIGNGFHVTAEITDDVVEPASCGGTYFLDESQLPTLSISSPYSDQSDRTSESIMNCWWYLNAPAGQQIRLDLGDIQTTAFENLKIFDGRYDAKKIPMVFSDAGPNSLVSAEGGMLVYLEDRRLLSQHGRGFILTASISDIQEAVGEMYPSLSGMNIVCNSTHMTVFMTRSLLAPEVDPDTLQFKDDNCVSFTHHSDQIALSTKYNRCKTVREQTTDYILFTNVVQYSHAVPFPGTSITRVKKDIYIRARCQLDRQSDVAPAA